MNQNAYNYPANVGWDVTGKCNHKCFYCYNYWRSECAKYPEESDKSYTEITDFIISKKPAVVTISGGEPLLVFDEIKKHIINFRENGIHVRIFTNASLITEDIASFCKNHQIGLMVSFPSVNRGLFGKITNNNNTYDAVVNGMDLLRDYDVYFTPNIVVSKMNLDSFESTAKWLIERYHPGKLFISRVTRPANATDMFEQYALDKNDLSKLFLTCEQIKNAFKTEISGCGGTPYCIFPNKETLKMFGKSCGAGKNGYCVDMAGNVRACSRDIDNVGNVFTDDFNDIRERLLSWGERAEIPEKCQNCRVAGVCRGGCRMTNQDYLRNGKAVDCDASPKNAPHSLPRSEIRIPPLKVYTVMQGIKCVEIDRICRLSYLLRYVYVDKRFAEYLLNKKQISVFKTMLDMKISFPQAKEFVCKLLSAGIIQV